MIRKRSAFRSTAQTVVGLALLTVGFLATLATVLGFFGDSWWAFDALANLRFQLAIVLLIAGVLYGLVLGRGAAVLFVVMALVNAALVLPLYTGSPAQARGGDELTLLSFNVRASNDSRARVVRWVEQSDADIVFLLESTVEWEEVLESAESSYEVAARVPDDRRFGIIALTRVPATAETLRIGSGEEPVIRLEATLDDRPLVVYAVHPRPATSETGTKFRNALLSRVADMAGEEVDPVVVIGDLNATPWSSAFRSLQSEAGLINSLEGYGLQPTWPGNLPFGFNIPIDHALHSSELTTVSRDVGPNLGSDHRPLIVTLARAVA